MSVASAVNDGDEAVCSALQRFPANAATNASNDIRTLRPTTAPAISLEEEISTLPVLTEETSRTAAVFGIRKRRVPQTSCRNERWRQRRYQKSDSKTLQKEG